MTAAIVALLSAVPGPCRAHAAVVAPVIVEEAEAADFDGLIVASVMLRESACRQGARGRAGEIGAMQILPRGMARRVCRGLRLSRLDENVRCGVRLLLLAREHCGTDPRLYLGRYNGRRACKSTRYSRRVLEVVKRTERKAG